MKSLQHIAVGLNNISTDTESSVLHIMIIQNQMDLPVSWLSNYEKYRY